MFLRSGIEFSFLAEFFDWPFLISPHVQRFIMNKDCSLVLQVLSVWWLEDSGISMIFMA